MILHLFLEDIPETPKTTKQVGNHYGYSPLCFFFFHHFSIHVCP